MPSRALGPASEACVFIFLHQTREHTILDYKRTVTEFLPEEFNHPIFLFLRPDGTEIDEGLRSEHAVMSGSHIVKVLNKHVWPETGKGLTPKAWKKAEEAVTAAREAMAAGDLRKAERLLSPAAKLKLPCGVKDRALLMQSDLAGRHDLLAAWDQVAAEMKDPPAAVRTALESGDFIAARATVSSRLVGDFENELDSFIKSRFEMVQAHHQLTIWGTTAHHYLEATFTCGVLKAEGLRVEISILSEAGDVLDGNAAIPAVSYSSRRMFSATVTVRAMKGNLVKAVRARLYLGDLLLAEKIEDGGPATWPAASKTMTGPDFYEPGDAWHVSRELEPVEIRVGRVH